MPNGLRSLHPATLRTRFSRWRRTALHDFARRWPPVYRAVVIASAAAGYVYLATFPLTALWLLGGLPARWQQATGPADWALMVLQLLLAALAGVITWQIVQRRFPPPAPEALAPHEAPPLFDLVDELQQSYRSPPLHRLALTDRFAVAVIRTPRSGYPLLFTNTLQIGLPVLQALSPVEVRVMLARRIGQLAARDSRIGSWLHQLRGVWPQYAVPPSDKRNLGEWALWLFFLWYAPLYRYLSGPATTEAEHDADLCALDIINDRDVAQALVTAMVRERHLATRFWPQIEPPSPDTPQPRALPFRSLTGAVRALTPERAAAILAELLAAQGKDGGDEGTPPLRARLEGLGQRSAPAPAPFGEDAATGLLAPTLAAQIDRRDRAWFRAVLPDWKRRHAKRQQHQQRLESLAAKAKAGHLDAEGAMKYALLAHRLLPQGQAMAVHKRLLATDHGNAKLDLTLGRLLLAAGASEGLEAMDRAIARDQSCTMSAVRLIAKFFADSGQPEAAKGHIKRIAAARA